MWKLRRTRQCEKFPWKKSVDPRSVPNGYCENKHAALKKTICEKGDISGIFSPHMHAMECHEMSEAHCIGWIHNQLGEGHSIPLRVSMLNCVNCGRIKTVGDQHTRFEDTLTNG